ncbi:MAG: MATE family efflux transporter [Planctomyces sp.]|jgi:MATE family multidrug resistance protein
MSSASTEADQLPSGTLRELVRVALPLMLSSGTQSLMNATDRAMLAGCSEDALAAVTPASMLYWTVVCVPMGVVLYANTFISQYEGAGKPERMLAAFWQSCWLALATGLLLLGLLPLTRPFLALTGHAPAVAEFEAEYFNTLCAGSPITLIAVACSCWFSGQRRTGVVMLVSMQAVVWNFAVDYLLVYGIGPFPELGIRGAAIATVSARCTELACYLVLLRQDARSQKLPFRAECRLDRELLFRYLRFGLPNGLHFFVDNSGFAAFLLLVGRISSTALAATNIAFSINGLIFIPLLGFGTAIQTLVGHHMGAGQIALARRTTWQAAGLGILWTGGTGLLLVLFPQAAMQPFFFFSSDAGASIAPLAAQAEVLLQFVAVYSVFDALAVVFSSALRGAGDTVFPMLLTFACSWLVMVLPAWLVTEHFDRQLRWLWLAASANIIVAGLLMVLRYRAGAWQKIRVIESGKKSVP